MYIGKVALENIRGFADLQFDLARPGGSHAGWTVFTGDNGSGKSTLLKAIAVGLRPVPCNQFPSLDKEWRQGGEHSARYRPHNG